VDYVCGLILLDGMLVVVSCMCCGGCVCGWFVFFDVRLVTWVF